MSLENFMRIADALVAPLSYLLYENPNEIPMIERVMNVSDGRNGGQKEICLRKWRKAWRKYYQYRFIFA